MKLQNVEKKENSQIELSILVEQDEFEKACERSYKKNVTSINIQGFRKGKAPRKMIEKMYGKEIFYEDAMNFSFPEAYEKALEEADIVAIGRPSLTDFDVDENGVFTFKAIVTVKPDVTVGEYKGLEAEKPEAKLEKGEADAELERLRQRNARLISVDRPVQDGDTIMLDFEGFVDGVPFEGGKGEGFSLKIGSHTFIPGFEDQLVGINPGQECEVNVTFPEDYQAAELAGKAAVFKCKVGEVKESEMPALDDEFAKDVSEFDTLKQFVEDIEKKLIESKTAKAENEFEDALRRQLVDGMQAEIPEAMVEAQLDIVADDFNYRLSMQGVNLELYLQMNQMSMETFRSMFREQAQHQVKVRLALEKIAELEGFAPEADEVDAEIEKLAQQNGITPERVVEIVGRVNLSRDIGVKKAMEFVVANAKAVKPKAKKATVKKATEADGEPEKEEKKPAKKPAAKKKAEKPEAEEHKPEA